MIVCESVEFSGKLSFTLYPSLDPNDGQKDRQRPNTLATHGLEEHFSTCAVVSVFWLWRKKFQMILTYHTSCAVVSFFCGGKQFLVAQSVFWLWREKALGVTSLPTIPVVPLCQFFGCGGKQLLVTQFLRKILIWFL